MRFPPNNLQGHILGLPYEMLKSILTRLSQRDQLSIAKTCVHLWELAYPMVYDRIVVRVGLGTEDHVWRNLASGVGLRHVRHLKVHTSIQSTAYAEEPNHTADLVVGTLLAALRRHQLLSFGLTTSAHISSTMSMKNIVILLETQQKLTRISLPGTSGSRDISITDYLPVPLQLRNLRDITLELSTSNNVDHVSSAILRKSPSLNSVHLRFSAQDNDPFFQISAAPTRWPSSRCFLFSLATKLTILSYDFRNFTALLSMPTLPALCALAVVDCRDDIYFHHRFLPKQFPKLRALMFTTTDSISGDRLARFIEGLSCLRELVVWGNDLSFKDGASLLSHAHTLELLCLHRMAFRSVFDTPDDQSSCLSALTALRHLGVYIGRFTYCVSSTGNTCSKAGLATISANLTACDKLQTLTLRCSSGFSSQHTMLAAKKIALLSDRTQSEKLIGDATLSQLTHRGSILNDHTLQYLAVIVKNGASGRNVTGSDIEIIRQTPRRPKTILSLQPKQVLRPADLVKEEIMARFAKENYYFLEAYVGTMTEASHVKISGRS